MVGNRRVSSPASTGGAGTYFEQHVAAYWLAQLLVRAIPPILLDCMVEQVKLQTEYLGWHTDDILIIGQNGSGEKRKLACQVKRTFTISVNNDECQQVFQDFWKDFNTPELFSPDKDRFALITLRGTNTLLEHFSGLLDCARSSRTPDDFVRRMETPGFINGQSVKQCDIIQQIISDVEGRSVSKAEIWPFLRVLHVLSLDLTTETRQTEAQIRSLLAYTSNEHDSHDVAEATWNALLREVSEGTPSAKCYSYDDLPETLRKRHSPIGGKKQRILQALSDHSALILGSIRSTIGEEIHLPRFRLIQQIIEQLETTQVVLISGPAGSGKSVIAKDVIDILSQDHFVFSFRAEEFAYAHLDQALQNSQIPARGIELGALLASQARKILLIESLERLLERVPRDAFTDLLSLLKNDKSWRLVLTCRESSTDLARAALLESVGIRHTVVRIQPLNDEELKSVWVVYPTLDRLLNSQALRELLRLPYFLDRVLQIDWSLELTLPQSERELRELFWKEIVRAERYETGMIPRRRGDTFIQIALQRARTLTPYAECDDIDFEALNALRKDSLIVSHPKNDKLIAPAHDILEDWAILCWIEEQYVKHNGSFLDLASDIDTHPAVRRAYRKWVMEFVERDPDRSDELFQIAVSDNSLPPHFRDDTLVSILRSSSSMEFLRKHATLLFANNKQLLRRVIHLLRVACVTALDFMDSATLYNVPEGPAWACILELIRSQLDSFDKEDCSLLLGLIEDWAKGVTWNNPYPDGAEAVASIAYWLLSYFDDYLFKDERKRTLKVIVKIPKADSDRFTALLHGRHEDDRLSDELREIIFESLEGMPVARDMPDLFVSVARDYLLCYETDLQRDLRYASSIDKETLFGIKEYRSFRFFPASAYRGPFLPLLRFHPRKGLDFIIDVFNHSAEWYAHPRVQRDIEPPYEIILTFTDGTMQRQWCNSRLWNWYRGTSVGPYVLQSILMALERWLLEYAEAHADQLDKVLLHILKRSYSAALTAVVAAVATAHPYESSETLLVLLRSKECILLDRERLANEIHSPSSIAKFLPRLNRDRIYDEERQEADALPHRRWDLENAILKLQLGSFAPRVHKILDELRAELPLVEEQDENDRIWRLVLHRMDLRNYNVTAEVIEGPSPEPTASEEVGHQYIRLDLTDPEPDLKEMVDQSAALRDSVNARSSLLVWGLKAFDYDEDFDHSSWRQKLLEARNLWSRNGSEEKYDLYRNAPGVIAAVCVRDHWEEMSADERDWCVDVVCSEIEREANQWDHLARIQRNRMSADRPCAWVLPSLLGKELNDIQTNRVRQALVMALTHAIDEVRWYAASGIGRHLWKIDRDLVLRCVNALAMEAKIVQEMVDAQESQPNNVHPLSRFLLYRRRIIRKSYDEIQAEASTFIRKKFFGSDGITDDVCTKLDLNKPFEAKANKQILAIFAHAPTEPVAVEGFERFAQTLVVSWDERRSGYEEGLNLFENFVLRTRTEDAIRIINPIVSAIDRHPDEVSWVLRGLISVEDRQPNSSLFWSIWEEFANGVRRAKWLARLNDEYAVGKEMISAIFLVTWWKEDVRHWRSLEGHVWRIHALFEELPASSTVLYSYLRFLYYIGEQSLPEAFIRIARRLQQGEPWKMLRNENTVFLLEVLLQRYVYGRPLELKRQSKLREAVLYLLDLLVENGSSFAFRMRDDFVTPISIDQNY